MLLCEALVGSVYSVSKSILESEMDAAVACRLLHSISLNVISEPMEGGYGPLQASQEPDSLRASTECEGVFLTFDPYP